MNTVTVIHDHRSYRHLKEDFLAVARHVLRGEECDRVVISIVMTGDRRMRILNGTFLHHPHVTDVLSFPLADSGEPLTGEIYINIDQAKRQAPGFNAFVTDELRRLIIHGVLHLIGYDDDSLKKRREMSMREDHYLNSIPAAHVRKNR